MDIWTADGVCDGSVAPQTEDTGDAASTSPKGCGCATGGNGALPPMFLLMFALVSVLRSAPAAAHPDGATRHAVLTQGVQGPCPAEGLVARARHHIQQNELDHALDDLVQAQRCEAGQAGLELELGASRKGNGAGGFTNLYILTV